MNDFSIEVDPLDDIIQSIASGLSTAALNYWHQQPRREQVELAVMVQRKEVTISQAWALVEEWA